MNFELLKSKAMASGIKEIEVYSVKESRLSLQSLNDKIERNALEEKNVRAIRGAYNNQIVTVYEESDSDENIAEIINKIIDNCSIINKDEPYFIYAGDKEYPSIKIEAADFTKHSLKSKIDLVLNVGSETKSLSPYITNTKVSYEQTVKEVHIENSNGLNVVRNTHAASLYVSVVAEKDGETKTGWSQQVRNKIADFQLPELAKEAVERATSAFGAETIPSGNYQAVLDKLVVRSIISGFSEFFSADSVLKNTSFLKDKIGQKIFGSNVTFIDDPLCNAALNQYAFDDEGVGCRAKTVVEQGVLKTYLHNLRTASMFNVTSTGNGFKDSVASSVGVNCANFYLKPGDKSFSELLELVGNGIYITNVTGLHAGLNQISGDFSLQSSGFLIIDGKIGKPVNLIIISGKFQDLLNNVIGIADDLEFHNSFGMPSIAVKNLAISGK